MLVHKRYTAGSIFLAPIIRVGGGGGGGDGAQGVITAPLFFLVQTLCVFVCVYECAMREHTAT